MIRAVEEPASRTAKAADDERWSKALRVPPIVKPGSATGSHGIDGPRARFFGRGGRVLGPGERENWHLETGGFLQLAQTITSREESDRPYEENVWVRAAVDAIAAGFQRLKLRLYDRDPVEEEASELTDHPLLELLRDPTYGFTERSFWFAHAVAMKHDGENVWFLADEDGQPVESNPRTRDIESEIAQIIPVRGGMVDVEHDPSGRPKNYRYQTTYGRNGASVSPVFPEASVVHFRKYDPYNPTRGIGDVQSLVRETDIYFQSQRAQDASFRNGGTPDVFITYEHDVDPHELERRQDALDEETSGENARRLKFLAGKAKVTPVPVRPVDMGYGETQDRERDAILAGLGVSPPVLGIYDAATYNNVETAHREMFTGPNGILALGAATADVIQNELLPRMSGAEVSRSRPIYVAFDHSMIEVLREDVSEKITLAADIAAKGVGITANEVLERMSVDVEGFEEGDLKLLASALDEMQEMVVDESGDAQAAADPSNTLNGAQIASLLSVIEQVRTGAISKDTATQILVASFPFDEPRVERILQDVEEGADEPEPAPAAEGPAGVEEPDTESDGGDDAEASEPSGESGEGAGGDAGEATADLAHGGAAVAYAPEVEADPKLAGSVVLWLNRYEREQVDRLRRIARGGLRYLPELDNVVDPRALSEEEWDALLLANASWSTRLDRAVRVALRDVWADALDQARGEVGDRGPILTTETPEVYRQIGAQRIALSEGVTSTTANRVRNAMARHMTGLAPEGKTLRQLIKDELPELTPELQRVFGNKEARASAIARTESGAADNGARWTQYAASDVESVRWIASQDEAVRASHNDAHGTVVALGSAFSNGLTRPHQPGAPAREVVNCRCRLAVASYRNPFPDLDPDADL